ncbi:MAG TPA: hypothetical protein VM686_36790 [Polyangiaceae bacterium]|jgi:hypothetical protein|nr:hypothetical protein [Polyangiaceae bacterium]
MTWEQKSQGATQRFAERLQQEHEAPRLAALIPALESLKLAVEERRGTWPSATPEGSHVRHVVVPSAPALFLITCHDPECRDGGHDVTALVMRALRARELRFEGKAQCYGHVGSADCQRAIRFVGTAAYRASGASP